MPNVYHTPAQWDGLGKALSNQDLTSIPRVGSDQPLTPQQCAALVNVYAASCQVRDGGKPSNRNENLYFEPQRAEDMLFRFRPPQPRTVFIPSDSLSVPNINRSQPQSFQSTDLSQKLGEEPLLRSPHKVRVSMDPIVDQRLVRAANRHLNPSPLPLECIAEWNVMLDGLYEVVRGADLEYEGDLAGAARLHTVEMCNRFLSQRHHFLRHTRSGDTLGVRSRDTPDQNKPAWGLAEGSRDHSIADFRLKQGEKLLAIMEYKRLRVLPNDIMKRLVTAASQTNTKDGTLGFSFWIDEVERTGKGPSYAVETDNDDLNKDDCKSLRRALLQSWAEMQGQQTRDHILHNGDGTVAFYLFSQNEIRIGTFHGDNQSSSPELNILAIMTALALDPDPIPGAIMDTELGGGLFIANDRWHVSSKSKKESQKADAEVAPPGRPSPDDRDQGGAGGGTSGGSSGAGSGGDTGTGSGGSPANKPDGGAGSSSNGRRFGGSGNGSSNVSASDGDTERPGPTTDDSTGDCDMASSDPASREDDPRNVAPWFTRSSLLSPRPAGFSSKERVSMFNGSPVRNIPSSTSELPILVQHAKHSIDLTKMSWSLQSQTKNKSPYRITVDSHVGSGRLWDVFNASIRFSSSTQSQHDFTIVRGDQNIRTSPQDSIFAHHRPGLSPKTSPTVTNFSSSVGTLSSLHTASEADTTASTSTDYSFESDDVPVGDPTAFGVIKFCIPHATPFGRLDEYSSEEAIAAIHNEVDIYDAASRLQGTNLCQFYGLFKGNYEGLDVWAMILSRARPFTVKRWERIADKFRAAVIESLQSFHDEGLVHNDLKPWHFCEALNPLRSKLILIDLEAATHGSLQEREEEMRSLKLYLGVDPGRKRLHSPEDEDTVMTVAIDI